MYHTAEVRWFFKGEIPFQVRSVYFNQDDEPIPQPFRTDHYLTLTNRDDLGIKLRQGAIEIKERTEHFGEYHFNRHVAGYIDYWLKWHFEISPSTSSVFQDVENSTRWIAIHKKRWLHRYVRKENDGVLGILGSEVVNGCEWELSQIQIEGYHTHWWSMAFEAFGSQENLLNLLVNVVMRVANDMGKWTYSIQESHSYPSWLALLRGSIYN